MLYRSIYLVQGRLVIYGRRYSRVIVGPRLLKGDNFRDCEVHLVAARALHAGALLQWEVWLIAQLVGPYPLLCDFL